MCLAVPGQVVECIGQEAVVEMQGNRLRISRVLTPDARPGDWVLVHAGFSISTLDSTAAAETWDYLSQAYGPLLAEEGLGGSDRLSGGGAGP